ncbi:MAG TPA: tetratricopeptide repeat protein, partial [Methylomirabilota bacterium]|nr:tetratricopeptide repeat protein [Methylomirabilota bacterium]
MSLEFQRYLGMGWLFLGLAGCTPTMDSRLDEEKNPFFQEGRRRVAALDYKGAIEAFERTLETNPRSALAHYELAVLYDERENNYPAAIYHYTKAIELRPDGSYPADLARTRIPVCKQEMVKTESMATINPSGLRELERLREEAAQWRRQFEAARAELARCQAERVAAPAPAPPADAALAGSGPAVGGSLPAGPARTSVTRTH